MSGVSRKPDKDRPLDFKGFLKDLNDWDYLLGDKDQKMKGSLRNAGKLDEDRGPPKKIVASESKRKAGATSGVTSSYLNYSGAVSQFSSSFPSDEKLPDAASEKELGNEYFKQKKYREAIECYSRSIVLSPTSVAFANRAMAYIKVKGQALFEEAENDCTEALNLDDRYVKAYSRRATARKELGKFKAAMEDAEFVVRLEPNNQEVRKQYTEAKELLEKEIAKTNSGTLKSSTQGFQKSKNSEMTTKGVQNVLAVSSNAPTVAATSVQTSSTDSKGKASSKPLIAVNDVGSKGTSTRVETKELMNGSHGSAVLSVTERNAKVVQQGVGRRKQDMDASMQDLASRAASRIMATAAKNISAPKSAYEFEVSWRALSGDSEKQACLLKTILPATLPQIFKNALSAPMLIEIIKCTATIFKEDTQFAVCILENLTKVPRFDMIVMCLSAVDHAEIHHVWEQVFSTKDIQADRVEILCRLRPKFCYGEWQAHVLGSTGWPK